MLLSNDGPLGLPTELDSIHNYYEGLVFNAIQEKLPDQYGSTDYIADIACIALNELPSRYIRHDVDMAFFLSSNDRQMMASQVDEAVSKAIAYVNDSKNQKS